MYRDFQDIEVTRKRIILKLNDGQSFEYNYPDKEIFYKNESGNQHIISGVTKQSMCILKDRICMFDVNGDMEFFQTPKETLYYIEKDIKKHGFFSLEYRKHLKWKYDKRHARIHYMPGCHQTILKKFDEIKYVYFTVSEEFGRGVYEKPIIVFSPSHDGYLYYVVIQNYITVATGVI